MTETIHIFDEFLEDELTNERRHQKRVKLEPLVFDILKRKYGDQLRTNWQQNPPPRNSKKCVLIIERRIHENLEFLFHNAVYFAKEWSICFVCSDMNLEYCKQITQFHENIHFLPIFRGSPSYSEARNEYNMLLKSPAFYEDLPWEHLLILQTDSYLRKQVPDSILQYDLVSSPALWDQDEMVGGISFRNTKAMRELIHLFQEDISSEDVYFSKGSRALKQARPSFETAMTYFAESCLYEDPVGVHQWWTFFFLSLEDAELIFHNYLTLEMPHAS